MEDYIKVNVAEYVNNGINNGKLIPREAEKFARILARLGNDGEHVISWSVDANGNEIVEKVSQVQDGDWVITKVDEFGEVIVDANGHTNEWIVSDANFKKKYEIDPDNPSLCRPKGGIQIFVQIPDNIILEQWGSEMKIASGGYINITNVNDMYGISQRDFEDTYKFCDEINREVGR